MDRLRRSGWSAAELDEQLWGVDDAGFLRVRHAVTRESPALVRDLVGHADGVNACAVTPDGRRVVSASWDKTPKLWDSPPVVSTRGVTACTVTPDGQRVVSASWDQTLKLWGLATGRVLATIEGHTGPVNACAVTLDGGRVVSVRGQDAQAVGPGHRPRPQI